MLRYAFTLVAMGIVSHTLSAAELVGVRGSDTKFPAEVEASVTGQVAQLTITGTALRAKHGVHAYAIASYVLKDADIHSAAELAHADCAKRLHLVMERPVDGKKLADAFRSAIRLNHDEPAFVNEIRILEQYMRHMAAGKGEHLIMTHLPGIGLHIRVADKVDFVIRNVAFSRAIWDIFLGKKNVGEKIKKELTSRL